MRFCTNLITGSRHMLIPVLFIACSMMINCVPKVELAGFDKEHWIEDRNGCSGSRYNQKQIIRDNQGNLLGKTSKQIIYLLGKPDRNELFNRNQKFYIYLIEPGPDCNIDQKGKLPETLFVRFSATGISQEVFIKKGASPI